MSEDYNFQIRVTGILVEDGKILIVKQRLSENRLWSLPGGRLENGETIEQGIIREFEEETGLIISVDRMLYLCDVCPNYNVVHVTFLVKKISGEISLPDNRYDENPILDVKFVKIDELDQYGFSEKFIKLVSENFPLKGNYMGLKNNIGLGL